MADYISITFNNACNTFFVSQNAFPERRFQCNLDDRNAVREVNVWTGRRFCDGNEEWNVNNLYWDQWDTACQSWFGNYCFDDKKGCFDDKKGCFDRKNNFQWKEGEERGEDEIAWGKQRKFGWNGHESSKDYVYWTDDKDLWPHDYLPWNQKKDDEEDKEKKNY